MSKKPLKEPSRKQPPENRTVNDKPEVTSSGRTPRDNVTKQPRRTDTSVPPVCQEKDSNSSSKQTDQSPNEDPDLPALDLPTVPEQEQPLASEPDRLPSSPTKETTKSTVDDPVMEEPSKEKQTTTETPAKSVKVPPSEKPPEEPPLRRSMRDRRSPQRYDPDDPCGLQRKAKD